MPQSLPRARLILPFTPFLLSLALLSCESPEHHSGKTVQGIILDTIPSAGGDSLIVGYSIDGRGYVRTLAADSQFTYTLYNCIDLPYSLAAAEGAFMVHHPDTTCSEDQLFLIRGYRQGHEAGKDLTIRQQGTDTTFTLLFEGDRFFASCRADSNLSLTFTTPGRKNKWMKLIPPGTNEQWVFDLDLKFEPGIGTDSAIAHYDTLRQDWVWDIHKAP